MAIKATIDSKSYSGIENIEVGGKNIALEETYTGTKAITANGTYDVSGYANAEVNVPTEGETVTLQEKTITENGTYVPDEGYDGLSQVVVNVASSGGSESASGTFVGNGERLISLTLPATAEYLLVYSDKYNKGEVDPTVYTAYDFLVGFWKKGVFAFNGGINYNSLKSNAAMLNTWNEPTSNNPRTWDDFGNFNDPILSNSGGSSKTINGETYHWIAW